MTLVPQLRLALEILEVLFGRAQAPGAASWQFGCSMTEHPDGEEAQDSSRFRQGFCGGFGNWRLGWRDRLLGGVEAEETGRRHPPNIGDRAKRFEENLLDFKC